MSKAKPPGSEPAPIDELSYEQAVEELESIIERIESGAIGLEDSIRQYERGSGLLRRCREILGQAEQRIERLDAASLPAGEEKQKPPPQSSSASGRGSGPAPTDDEWA